MTQLALTDYAGYGLDDPRVPGPGKTGRRHPLTSVAAAQGNLPRRGTQRWRILDLLHGSGDGWTRDEIASILGLSPNSVRPRLVELVEGGWVQPDPRGTTRRTPLGHEAQVMVLTDRALEALS